MAAVGGPKLGIAAAVYRNTGTFVAPTWVEITHARDVTVNYTWNLADASSRGSLIVLQAKTQMTVGGQIVVRADDEDADYIDLFDASFQSSNLGARDLLILDGTMETEGARGVRGRFNLSGAQNQSIGEVIYTTFDFSTTYHADGYPQKAVVGPAGTVTFTPVV